MRKNNPDDFNKGSQHERRRMYDDKSSWRHVRPDVPDYGLRSDRIHTPSSGFTYSEVDDYEADRFMNPNIDYIPDEPNRDLTGAWSGTGDYDEGPRKQRRSGRHHSVDRDISDLVHDVLSKHPDIDVSQIEVKARNKVVTLRGVVETRRLKRLIEDVIFGLPHILDVQNQLEVKASDFDRNRMS